MVLVRQNVCRSSAIAATPFKPTAKPESQTAAAEPQPAAAT
jgi:hypothetical protein